MKALSESGLSSILRLSPSTACGLFALRYLAEVRRPASVREIARFGRIPESRVAGTLSRLRKAGLVHSERGRGFTLDRAPGEITAFDVGQAIDRSAPPAPRCRMDYESCTFRDACPLSPLCCRIHDSAIGILRSFTLADLFGGLQSDSAYLELARKK